VEQAYPLEQLAAPVAVRTSRSLLQVRPRPTGVTLLAILSTIGGVFSLVLGGLLLLAGALLLSAFFVANGVVDFFLAIGYLDGSRWAWMLGIVFATINIAGSAVEIAFGLANNIIGMIFSGITIVYLMMTNVRVFFGRIPSPLMTPGNQSDQTVLPMATNSSPRTSSIARPCQKCGAMIPPGAGFCRSCGAVQ
jgi:zinc-ribbon domain